MSIDFKFSKFGLSLVMMRQILSIVRTTLTVGMLSAGFGHVINISSVAGKFGSNTRTSYCAAKFGLIGMMDSLRCEVCR